MEFEEFKPIYLKHQQCNIEVQEKLLGVINDLSDDRAATSRQLEKVSRVVIVLAGCVAGLISHIIFST